MFLGLIDNLERSVRKRDVTCLQDLRGYKTDKIVDVVEFAESREYLGRDVWEPSKETLWQIFHSDPAPVEIVLTGSPRGGKSFIAWISIAYISYLMGCMHSPQLEFGLSPGSAMFLVFQSVREETVKDALYNEMLWAIDDSPWFKENLPRNNKRTDRIIFPNNVQILPLTGNISAGVGKSIFSAVVTEINLMPTVQHSKRLVNSDKTVLDTGVEIYNTLRRRIYAGSSQYGGGFPGKLIGDSAREFVGDWSDRKIAEAQNNPQILVVNKKLWEARRHQYPASEPRFFVKLGDDYHPARILSDDEVEEQGLDIRYDYYNPDNNGLPENILAVPERHRQDFEADLEKALVELAGVPSRRTGRFISNPEKVVRAQENYLTKIGERQIFKTHEASLQDLFDGGFVDWSKIVDYDYLKQLSLSAGEATVFSMHCDLSKSKDASGFALGHIAGYRPIDQGRIFSAEDKQVKTVTGCQFPEYVIDGLIRFKPRPGERIDPNLVRDLGLELKKHLNIVYGTADQVSSDNLLMVWRNNKIESFVVSVEFSRNPGFLYELRHSILEERIYIPPDEIIDTELKELKETTTARGKVTVDHPVPHGCLAGDTKISLLDGTEKTIRELAENDDGSTIGVYTIDNGKVSVGMGYKPRLTQRNAETVIVSIDNHSSICCTPDHRFMMRDGTYKQAKDLSPGDSLMPLYRKIANKVLYRVLRQADVSMDEFKSWLQKPPAISQHFNHKVVSVVPGPRQDVYDLSVFETENFALTNGIFVHNSKDLVDGVLGVLGVLFRMVASQNMVLDSPTGDETYQSPTLRHLNERSRGRLRPGAWRR